VARYESAFVLVREGDHARAEDALDAVLVTALQVLGPRHRDTLLIRDGLGELYLAQDRFAEAERAYRALIADQEIALGAEDPDTLATRIDLAWAIGITY
jgi:predicted Zn-dependent protease